VLVNPAVDVTETMLDHASVTEHALTPTLAVPQLQLVQRLAVPPGADPRAVSPPYADDLNWLAPALVVVPTHDPVADGPGCAAGDPRVPPGLPHRLIRKEAL
jgi:acetyl esterase